MRIVFLATALFSLLCAAATCRAAGIAAVSVSASVLSKSNCKFTNPALTVLDFGALDPGNPVDVSVAASVGFRCAGSAPEAIFSIAHDGGRHETGPGGSRMRHSVVPTEYLPYSFTLSPVSGTVPKNVPQTLTISGTLRGADYQDAYAGNYSDSIVVTLLP